MVVIPVVVVVVVDVAVNGVVVAVGLRRGVLVDECTIMDEDGVDAWAAVKANP